jgi:type II restriction enzyme
VQQQPSLFGIQNSNRDFSKAETWGKNVFNSSFPAALCCYLESKNEQANYLAIRNSLFKVDEIEISSVFGASPKTHNIFYAFESAFSPYQKYVIGSLPRTDLVTQSEDGTCLAGLEVKLTALPDHTTCNSSEDRYGSEIVVRPDTIVYLACSIASCLGDKLGELIVDLDIDDWETASEVLVKIDKIVASILKLSIVLEEKQHPFLLQPVWKTIGKSPKLADNCLDVFVWSNAAFTYFIAKNANPETSANSITRPTRASIWLYKMLLDIVKKGHFDHEEITDKLAYNTRNDKAFSTAGAITNLLMRCHRLTKPLIRKDEIKNIILGGGQNLLSPERRFDAIICNTPGLFDK